MHNTSLLVPVEFLLVFISRCSRPLEPLWLQARMDASTRSSLDPSLIPTLTANIEQEGMLRYDRGEQLLERIRDKTVLHRLR